MNVLSNRKSASKTIAIILTALLLFVLSPLIVQAGPGDIVTVSGGDGEPGKNGEDGGANGGPTTDDADTLDDVTYDTITVTLAR